MLNAIDAGGIRRLAGTILAQDKPADRDAALISLRRNLGIYDQDGESIPAAVDSYFKGLERRG